MAAAAAVLAGAPAVAASAMRRTIGRGVQLRLMAPPATAIQRHVPHRLHVGVAAFCSASAASASSSASDKNMSATANSYIGMGAFETMGTDVGRAAIGISYLEEALRVSEENYDKEVDHRRKVTIGIRLAQQLLEVGRHHHQQSDPHTAIPMYERALALVEEAIELRGREDSQGSVKAVTYSRFLSSEVCSGLGVAQNDVGQQDQALEMLQKALSMRKEIVGKQHPSLAECFNNLGACYYQRGNFSRSAEQYEQALEYLTEAAGGRQEGPHVALTLYNIGVCRRGLGQLPQAVAALQRAQPIAEAALGHTHAQVELIKETLAQVESGKPPPLPKTNPTTPDTASSS